jgi:hypothetical protein
MSEDLEFYHIAGGKVVVTTSTGWAVECLPYADQLNLVGTSLTLPEGLEEPQPPRYELRGEFVEGDTRPYDEESIKDAPEEDQEAWEQYLIDKAEYDAEVSALDTRIALLRARFMALKATRVVDQPDLQEWKREQEEEWGIPRPDDPNDLKFEFFLSEVVRGTETDITGEPADATKLMLGIARASGMDREALDAVEERFRYSLGIGEGQDAETDPGVPEQEEQEQATRVVDF